MADGTKRQSPASIQQLKLLTRKHPIDTLAVDPAATVLHYFATLPHVGIPPSLEKMTQQASGHIPLVVGHPNGLYPNYKERFKELLEDLGRFLSNMSGIF